METLERQIMTTAATMIIKSTYLYQKEDKLKEKINNKP